MGVLLEMTSKEMCLLLLIQLVCEERTHMYVYAICTASCAICKLAMKKYLSSMMKLLPFH